MSLGTILVIILIIALLGGFSAYADDTGEQENGWPEFVAPIQRSSRIWRFLYVGSRTYGRPSGSEAARKDKHEDDHEKQPEATAAIVAPQPLKPPRSAMMRMMTRIVPRDMAGSFE